MSASMVHRRPNSLAVIAAISILASCGRTSPSQSPEPPRQLRAEPSRVDFGPLGQGDSTTANLTLINDGEQPATLERIRFADLDFRLDSPVATTLAAGARMPVTIRATAQREGEVSSAVTFSWRGESPATVSLRYFGEGEDAADGGAPRDAEGRDADIADGGEADGGPPDAGRPDSGVPLPPCDGPGPIPEGCPDRAGRIGLWMTLGTFPYRGCGASLDISPLAATVRPRVGDTAAGRTWTRAASDQASGRWITRCQPEQSCIGGPASVDLNCIFSESERGNGPPDRASAFALTYLHVTRALDVRVRVGADDGVRVWLDGRLELDETDHCACWADDQFEADVALDPGVHVLLVRVGDDFGHWGFTLRLVDDSGAPIRSGVRALLTP